MAKLLDFGLVKPLLDDQPMQLNARGSITGSRCSCRPNRPPERPRPTCGATSTRSAVGYYLLTGRPPFESDKPMKVLIAHIHRPVVPTHHRSEIPLDLEAVILRCLEKAPADRFADVAALADALDACEDADDWSREDATRWWQEHRDAARRACERARGVERGAYFKGFLLPCVGEGNLLKRFRIDSSPTPHVPRPTSHVPRPTLFPISPVVRGRRVFIMSFSPA